jgi:hypothetical protein
MPSEALEAVAVVLVDPRTGVQREALDDGDAAVERTGSVASVTPREALLQGGLLEDVEPVLREDVGGNEPGESIFLDENLSNATCSHKQPIRGLKCTCRK